MQDHLFHRKDFFFKFPCPVATLGNCLTESSKRSLTFMEQMFPCGMMSHESRRMWEREEGVRKKRELREEEERDGGNLAETFVHQSQLDGHMNERLETRWMKLKSIVHHLITSLWRFLQGRKKHQRGKYGSFSIHPANIPTFTQIFL